MTRSDIVILLPLLIAGAYGQSAEPKSLPEVQRAVRDFFSMGDYDKAVPLLEQALATKSGDLTLLSLLGTAYLYSASRIGFAENYPRAREAMDRAVAGGGEAVFLVGKANERMKGRSILRATSGELRISKQQISFVPLRKEESDTEVFPQTELKECGPNRSYGKDNNAFHIKTSRHNIDFRPLHFSRQEADLVCELAAKYLGLKVTN